MTTAPHGRCSCSRRNNWPTEVVPQRISGATLVYRGITLQAQRPEKMARPFPRARRLETPCNSKKKPRSFSPEPNQSFRDHWMAKSIHVSSVQVNGQQWSGKCRRFLHFLVVEHGV